MEKSVGEKCCREVLGRSVAEECCREMLEKSVGEKCRREVLERSGIEKCWSSQHRQEMPTNAQLFEYGLFATFAYLLPGHPTLSATFDYFRTAKKWTQTHSGFILAGPSYLNV